MRLLFMHYTETTLLHAHVDIFISYLYKTLNLCMYRIFGMANFLLIFKLLKGNLFKKKFGLIYLTTSCVFVKVFSHVFASISSPCEVSNPAGHY